MYFKVLIETEFQRGGSTFEIVRYVEAENTVFLFNELEKIPSLNAKELGYAVTTVQAITKEEYAAGKEAEANDPRQLRVHARFIVKETCTLAPLFAKNSFSEPVDGVTIDISSGGLGVGYPGDPIPVGTEVRVTIKALDIEGKAGRIVWSFSREGSAKSGLFWLQH